MNLFAIHAITEASAQTLAQISVEPIFNALPEGLLIAFFAWALLRVLRRQNSGTRFAVWFLALLMVAVLPLLGSLGREGKVLAPGMAWGHLHPAITIPGRWALFAFIAWALGASIAMARLIMGLWHLRQLRRSCTAIAASELDPLDPLLRRTIQALGAATSAQSKAVTIATSEQVRVPAAIGFWKRTIVLPAWAFRELPPADLNVILLHEYAHLRRGDDWTNLVQKIVRAIFFFHPAVWWIESRLSVEREMACDDAVLAETSNPRGYASCLVSLLEKSMARRLEQEHLAQKRWSMAQAVVDRAREASLRLARILDANRPVATRVWKPALGVVGAFSMLCLALLSQAPQFIAFDRGTHANSDHAYTASITQLASNTGAMVGSPVKPGVNARISSTLPHAVAHHLAPARAVGARWSGNGPGNVNWNRREDEDHNSHMTALPMQITPVAANADRELEPQLQTLVFIEATQYMTYGSPVWSVQVWQVTFVSTVHKRLVSVPVANSI
jgi:hypothetical protein